MLKTKLCPHCLEQKALDCFYTRPNGKPHSWCKACTDESKERLKERYRNTFKILPERKVCADCRNEKDAVEFYRCINARDGLYSYCKLCASVRIKAVMDKDRPGYRKYKRDEWARVKNAVIDGYGGKCACCGETIREFLTLDHVNNDGAEQRKRKGIRQNTAYRDALRRNFPPEYQVLCFNCNCSKGFFGCCPHKLLSPRTNES